MRPIRRIVVTGGQLPKLRLLVLRNLIGSAVRNLTTGRRQRFHPVLGLKVSALILSMIHFLFWDSRKVFLGSSGDLLIWGALSPLVGEPSRGFGGGKPTLTAALKACCRYRLRSERPEADSRSPAAVASWDTGR
jgi:hypothetical protein